jgi:hypothetical protein
MTEAGVVGVGCARPASHDDLHLSMDALGAIQRPLEVPGWGVRVEALYITSLLPSAPKVLLNLESDDCCVLEDRQCGCPLGDLGLTQHLRDVRSYHKITGEGVTLVDGSMARILEEYLPARFGGTLLDYQLLEEEDSDGLTRLSLLVSPEVDLPDEGTVVGEFLQAVRQEGLTGSFSAAVWEHAGALRLRRLRPAPGAGGKFTPLRIARDHP